MFTCITLGDQECNHGDAIPVIDSKTGDVELCKWETTVYSKSYYTVTVSDAQGWIKRGWKPCRVRVDGFYGHESARITRSPTHIAALAKSGHVVLVVRKADEEEREILGHTLVPLRIEGSERPTWVVD